MSLRRPHRLWLLTATALWLLAAVGAAVAVPASASLPSKARLDRAVQRHETARRHAAELDARARKASAELDDILARERDAQERLNHHASEMYRGGEKRLAWLLESGTIQELSTRWDVLARMAREEARALERLEQLRKEASVSARSLLALQTEQARALEILERDVTAARKDLVADQAALAAYRARVASSRPQRIAAKKKPIPPAPQKPQGSGAWKSAVASHYGRDFSGRGANGEPIEPYSMMVAHRTLPFGTLIEFEYRGKRAVAKVADRGPHIAGREFDLGPGVVRVLDFSGVDTVRYRIIGK